MTNAAPAVRLTAFNDLLAGLVVFLVALPLCLGVALAAKAPALAGILAGVIGGVLVGILSKSHTSVSGPSPGLAAVVFGVIASLGFEGFLAALIIAGAVQIALGVGRMGFVAEFFPSSVIKGLLAAIGVLLVLKQLPHVVGHDPVPSGDFSFWQTDNLNTFTEIVALFGHIEPGAAIIGISSIGILLVWDRIRFLKNSIVPSALVIVIYGIGMGEFFRSCGQPWMIDAPHLVQVPVISTLDGALAEIKQPSASAWLSLATWQAGLMLAIVASLETLLNLEAVDRIDPQARTSPPNRELIAQGIGNVVAGCVGAMVITSVIVRSSVNINAGAKTKLSSIVHGLLLLACVALLPAMLNRIPMSCLAAILFVTGVKLASIDLIKQMWAKGKEQFLPFVCTILAMVLTDLLTGVIIGLAIAAGFILWSNVRRPLRRIVETHVGGQVLHLQLANQVSFLNRAAMFRVLDEVPAGGHILIDAQDTDYIDPDVLDLIRDFEKKTAPSRGIQVSLQGFHQRYQMLDRLQFVDYSTRELQQLLTPEQVLDILLEGYLRFRNGQPLRRNASRQIGATATGQFPLAVVLSCMDSRSTADVIFDQGIGDIFGLRIAGNIAECNVLGSMEYACAIAGAKLIVVMGHTKCGAITAAVDQYFAPTPTGCCNLDELVGEIQKSLGADSKPLGADERIALIEEASDRNILRTVGAIHALSPCLAKLEAEGKIAVVAMKYDVSTGRIKFLSELPGGSRLTAKINGDSSCTA